MVCHTTTGPPKIGPPDHLWQLQLVPWTICGTADGPPRPNYGAVVGPPYNPAFITFYWTIAMLKLSCFFSPWSLKLSVRKYTIIKKIKNIKSRDHNKK